MHVTIDDELTSSSPKIKYLFYVSSELNGPAIELTSQFQIKIKTEIESEDVANYVKQVVSDFVSFSKYVDNEPFDEVYRLLKKTDVNISNGIDLTARMLQKPAIISQFFNVKTVIDLKSNNQMLRDALDEHGLTLITDSDLKVIKKRIDATSHGHRVNFGFVDFFGFDKEFFRYLKGDKFDELISSINNIDLQLNRYLFEFLGSKINEIVLDRVTNNLLIKGIIHPYSVNIIPAYMVRKISKAINYNTTPIEYHRRSYPENFLSKEKLIELVLDDLLSSSEKFMNGDYSDIEALFIV